MSVAILAVICFNNWFLGIILNPKLLFGNGAVSEFSSPSEPYALAFRTLDIVAGFLFLICALLLAGVIYKAATTAQRLFLILTAILGVANIVDALFPLRCSQASSAACIIPLNLSLAHFQLPSHAYSSIIIAISYFLLPLCGWFYAHNHPKTFGLMTLNAAALLAALLAVGSVLLHYLRTGSYSMRGTGISQEVQMLILGIWFILYCMTLLKIKNTKQNTAHTDHPLTKPLTNKTAASSA